MHAVVNLEDDRKRIKDTRRQEKHKSVQGDSQKMKYNSLSHKITQLLHFCVKSNEFMECCLHFMRIMSSIRLSVDKLLDFFVESSDFLLWIISECREKYTEAQEKARKCQVNQVHVAQLNAKGGRIEKVARWRSPFVRVAEKLTRKNRKSMKTKAII